MSIAGDTFRLCFQPPAAASSPFVDAAAGLADAIDGELQGAPLVAACAALIWCFAALTAELPPDQPRELLALRAAAIAFIRGTVTAAAISEAAAAAPGARQ